MSRAVGPREKTQGNGVALVVHGTQVTVLRATLFGYNPAERATLAYHRLVSLIDTGGLGACRGRHLVEH